MRSGTAVEPKQPRAPAARENTARSALRAELATGLPCSVRDLARAGACTEKDIPAHLEHLQRTLKAEGVKLKVEPALCLACGYVFKDRAKLTTPSACPACRSERIAPPTFQLPTPEGA